MRLIHSHPLNAPPHLFFSKRTGVMKITSEWFSIRHIFQMSIAFQFNMYFCPYDPNASRWNICCMKHRRMPAWYHSQRRMPEALVRVPEEQRQEDWTLACAVQSKQHWGWWLKCAAPYILIALTLWLCTILSSTIHFNPSLKTAPTVLISLTSCTIVHVVLRALTTSYYVISGLDHL